MKHTHWLIILCVSLLLAACGSKKAMVNEKAAIAADAEKVARDAAEVQAINHLHFMEKVNTHKADVQNIVADINFTAMAGDKDVSAPGTLRMRRDKVIRIQLFIPFLGTEVGRLEFTPDYALVVDRLHKQYVKGDYNQLGFLRDNGLDFYSLQALFWNELFLPGQKAVAEADLSKFQVKAGEAGSGSSVSFSDGRLGCEWNVSATDGKINRAVVTYTSAAQGQSALTWAYSDFKPLGSKTFPATEEFSFLSPSVKKAKKITVQLRMDGFKTKDNWDAETTISSKYKQVDAKDVLAKLLSM